MKAHKLNTLNLEIGIVIVVLSMLAGPAISAPPPINGCGSAGFLCADQGDPPPCPTCPCPPGSGGAASSSGCATCPGGGAGGSFTKAAVGMASYWVSEPYMSLRLEDEPLGYEASRGPRVAFHLSYRQRGPAPESLSTFGVGNNWSCSFRSYLIDTGGSPDLLWLNRVGASYVEYTNGVMQYRDGSIATTISGGYQIVYADGATDTFTTSFVDPSLGTIYLLTSQADPTGNTLTYSYTTSSGVELLSTITDPDGRVTKLYYENTSFPNQITKVVDPYSWTNLLKYDSSGYLTNITDVAGLTSSFTYDAANSGWSTNLTTGYGSTGFSYGGTDVASADFNTTGNVVNRWVQIALPTGGTELYLFRQDCSGFMSSTYASVPSTSPLANTLDNVDQENRNSFYWSPLQYVALSTTDPNSFSTTDYSIGRLRHWLNDSTSGRCIEHALCQPGPESGQSDCRAAYVVRLRRQNGRRQLYRDQRPALICRIGVAGRDEPLHSLRTQPSKQSEPNN
jgi:YD repeat-containing protein